MFVVPTHHPNILIISSLFAIDFAGAIILMAVLLLITADAK